MRSFFMHVYSRTQCNTEHLKESELIKSILSLIHSYEIKESSKIPQVTCENILTRLVNAADLLTVDNHSYRMWTGSGYVGVCENALTTMDLPQTAVLLLLCFI